MQDAEFVVSAAQGCFGNHLRWLLLLDPKFNFKFTDFNLQPSKFYTYQDMYFHKYGHLNYNDFKNLNPDSIDQKLLTDYVNDFDLPTLDFTSTESKIKSIENYVYPKSRTWHNWLYFEFKFREIIQCITFDHFIPDFKSNIKYLSLVPDNVHNAFKWYVKWNSGLNAISKDELLWDINNFKNNTVKSMSTNPNVCMLNSDILYNHTLDKDIYKKAINHFGLSDCYNQANYVHGLWYELHKNSERQMISDLKELFEL